MFNSAYLVMVNIAGEVDVINPDLGSLLDGNGITGFGQDLGDLQVAENDIGLFQYTESNTDESYIPSNGKHVETSARITLNVQEPFSPITEVLEPTLTATFPVIVPKDTRY
jgi:hypothetical protein